MPNNVATLQTLQETPGEPQRCLTAPSSLLTHGISDTISQEFLITNSPKMEDDLPDYSDSSSNDSEYDVLRAPAKVYIGADYDVGGSTEGGHKALAVVAGDVVQVTKAGTIEGVKSWYRTNLRTGARGWVPSSYIVKEGGSGEGEVKGGRKVLHSQDAQQATSDDNNNNNNSDDFPETFVVTIRKSFEGDDDANELSVGVGDNIAVLDSDNKTGRYWGGNSPGHMGWFPMSCAVKEGQETEGGKPQNQHLLGYTDPYSNSDENEDDYVEGDELLTVTIPFKGNEADNELTLEKDELVILDEVLPEKERAGMLYGQGPGGRSGYFWKRCIEPMAEREATRAYRKKTIAK